MNRSNGGPSFWALCEFPLRGDWIEGVLLAARAAGLSLSEVSRVHRSGGIERRTLTDESSRVAASAIDDALVGSSDGLLELRGAGWEISFPMQPGLATGRLPGSLLDSPKALADLIGTLGDVCRSDWCLLDPRLGPPPPLPATATDAARLPRSARLLYLSADLAHQLDLVELTRIPELLLTRSICGAMITQAQPQALPRLARLLEPLRNAGPRPPTRAGHEGLPPAALIRSASSGLRLWQQHLVATVWSWCFGEAPPDRGFPEVDHLVRLDAALLSAPRPLPSEALEAWGALAGEVVVNAGGNWCRILHPAIAYPESLGVDTGSDDLFRPHALLAASAATTPSGLAQAAAAVLGRRPSANAAS